MGSLIGTDLGTIDIGSNLGNLSSVKSEKLFLKRFRADDLYEIMKEVGMIDHLGKRGFDDLNISIDVDESYIHYLKLYAGEASPETLLMALRLTETKFLPDKRFFEGTKDIPTYDMIVIEWLSAQNPKVNFDKSKPQLPGQTKPGLGILNFCFDMMYRVAREVTKDGFLDVPDHMHGSIMYSKKFKFFDPVQEAILKAILRDLKDYSLLDISWGMITGTIIDDYKNIPQEYDPAEQIFYISNRMKKYFNSGYYKSTFNKYYKRKRFSFDYDKMVEKRDQILKSKNIIDL